MFKSKLYMNLKMTVYGRVAFFLSGVLIWLYKHVPMFSDGKTLERMINGLVCNKFVFKYKYGTTKWKRVDLSDRYIEVM